MSLRLRLTVLYAAGFMLASAAVLAIVYALVAHDTGSHAQKQRSPSSYLDFLPNGKLAQVLEFDGVRVQLPLPSDYLGPHFSAAQLAEQRADADSYAGCMRAHGLDYPNPGVSRGPGGNGLIAGLPSSFLDKHPLDTTSAVFQSANRACRNLWPAPPAVGGVTAQRVRAAVHAEANAMIRQTNIALTTQRSHSLSKLLIWSGVAFGVMAVISILLGWLMGGRALRPLRIMTSRAQRITEENLHERLSAAVGEDEFGDLASTFDGVLARLERAFDSQKRFVANASHELRTPVTVERALLELALASPDADAETLRHVCERVLHSAKQQQQIVEALLALARTQGRIGVEATVDLADLAQAALRDRDLDAFALAADLQPAPVTGDPPLLERLITNLIDNAIVHNVPEGGWITIETGVEGSSSWVRISNSGPEVPESMISEIFEPFRRIEGERTATATGLGLGLSIVQGVTEIHDATISARPLDGGGLRVEVRF